MIQHCEAQQIVFERTDCFERLYNKNFVSVKGYEPEVLRPKLLSMWTIVIVLIILWLLLSVAGFVVEGLLWLAYVGIILAVVTAIFGWIRNRAQ